MSLREKVRDHYAERVTSGAGCCPADASPNVAFEALEVPSFGCGGPIEAAGLRPGERVLDLGSGAGLDAFRAARAVGPEGRVVGVDMTPEMLARARAGAEALGLERVEFREGLIEALPVADAEADVVVSNCVINLSEDKPRVFREAWRALAPGGRLVVSDILRHGAAPAAPSVEGWCACVDGAEPAAGYRRHLEAAGFVGVAVEPAAPPVPEGATYSAIVRARKARVRPAASGDRAAVHALLTAAGLPLVGLDDAALLVLDDPATGREGVVGAIGLEPRGEAALLRSLVLEPALRGRGWGRALLAAALAEARARGLREAVALTETVPAWLERLGFARVDREALPAAVRESAELRGACPATAAAFRRALTE